MSFEGVFENWLKTQAEEVVEDKTGGESEHQQQTVHPNGEAKNGEDKLDTNQDAFTTHSSNKFMLVNISSKQTGETRESPSPHPVPNTGPVGEDEVRQTRDCETAQQAYCKDKIQTGLEETKAALVPMVDCKHRKQRNMPVEGQDHQQCHTCSPLTDLRDVTPTCSPSGVEVSRLGDPILSPDHEVPMEPDSTSECRTSSKRNQCLKKGEIGVQKVMEGREGSPCSTGSAGESSAGVKPGTVTVQVEENQAECDSTCMFLASPNAISPASQGEIEERVCPLLTDHEDGASPAHCVCQCRSLPPPTNLLPRDHVPTITTATSASPPSLASPHLTYKIISNKSDNSSDINLKATLVSSESHYESKITSDLENFVTKLELRRKKKEDKHENETPVASLHEKECGKQYLPASAKTESAINTFVPEVKEESAKVKTQLDLSGVSADTPETSRQENIHNSGELGGSAKCDPQQNEVCDFAKNIDWDTAVAETLESSTSVRGYDGESKPGIILKIRAKAVVPCLEKNLALKSVKTVSSGKRKVESKGSPEILSRLRKRQKSEPSESQTLSCASEQAQSEQHSGRCKMKSRQTKMQSGGSSSCRNSSATRQRRRNTVHVNGNVDAYTMHLSPSVCKFVESSTKLSRLQTLTYDLVCSLFPLIKQQLSQVTPESLRFTDIVDDIINSLECSDSEEVSNIYECLGELFEKLKVTEANLVPVYSPRVVLCNDPSHLLEDFQHKVCTLLQLLLPDLTVSLSDRCLQSPGQLEAVVKQVLSANQFKDKSSRKCRVMSL